MLVKFLKGARCYSMSINIQTLNQEDNFQTMTEGLVPVDQD